MLIYKNKNIFFQKIIDFLTGLQMFVEKWRCLRCLVSCLDAHVFLEKRME